MSVSRAIMGRLDVVDLIGKHTATEVAERVSLHFSVRGAAWAGLMADGSPDVSTARVLCAQHVQCK